MTASTSLLLENQSLQNNLAHYSPLRPAMKNSKRQTMFTLPICTKCGDTSNANFVTCALCEQLFCRDCLELPAELIAGMIEHDIDFYCKGCKIVQRKFGHKLQKFEMELGNLKTEMMEHLQTLEAKVDSVAETSTTTGQTSTEELVAEALNRIKNQSWVVLRNVPEQDPNASLKDQNARDSAAVSEICEYLLPNSGCQPIEVWRFPQNRYQPNQAGASPPPRPLKIRFEPQWVGKLLKSKKNLAKSEHYQRYSMSPLLTGAQLAAERKATDEWKM